MFLLVTVVVPTFCYLGAALWLAVHDENYSDALMFAGYAVANIGIMMRLL
jgi:hypothetical protein